MDSFIGLAISKTIGNQVCTKNANITLLVLAQPTVLDINKGPNALQEE